MIRTTSPWKCARSFDRALDLPENAGLRRFKLTYSAQQLTPSDEIETHALGIRLVSKRRVKSRPFLKYDVFNRRSVTAPKLLRYLPFSTRLRVDRYLWRSFVLATPTYSPIERCPNISDCLQN